MDVDELVKNYPLFNKKFIKMKLPSHIWNLNNVKWIYITIIVQYVLATTALNLHHWAHPQFFYISWQFH